MPGREERASGQEVVIGQCFSNLNVHLNILPKYKFRFGSLECDLIYHFPDELHSDADAAGSQTMP